MWIGISVSHYRFRKAFLAQGRELSSLPFLAPGFPYMNVFVLVVSVVIILISGWSYFVPPSATGLVGSYAGPILSVLAFVFLKFWTKSKLVNLQEIDLVTHAKVYTPEDDEDGKKRAWYMRVLSAFA